MSTESVPPVTISGTQKTTNLDNQDEKASPINTAPNVDPYLRLECLKVAKQLAGPADADYVINQARQLEAYVTGTEVLTTKSEEESRLEKGQ